MLHVASFSFLQGDDSRLVQGFDHSDLYEGALTSSPCPLRDLESIRTHLSWVHTGKTDGLDSHTVSVLTSPCCNNDTRVTLAMIQLSFLVASCTPLFGLLTEVSLNGLRGNMHMKRM